ncbi:hypothetical protein HQ945_08560 [Phyllobacterium sp. BT25]|uniref:Uncharacterized protein n=1 Tax=Phyllobacterium pellucidum TaxID=2740464 RepID=A0A849VPE5_9HYPH|nr:hypothetical protein [Phyllobacterium pellucidum]NTS31306.1 hypothetical protein [Phyllobacterium pellucidum]
MNSSYRQSIIQEVKALPRNKFQRISHADFDRINGRINADYKAGRIEFHDFANCYAVIGQAVNGFANGRWN